MRIMLDTSLGIYCEGQTQTSIVVLKVISMIGTREHKSKKDTSFIILQKIKITW